MGSFDQAGLQVPVQTTSAANYTDERILSIRHWSPTVLSFRTTRYANFRFTAGHYARLGLAAAGRDDVVWRPYSIVSPAWAEYLEFLAVLIPGGAFSERLASLRVDDPIRVEKPAYGFLTVDRLSPGRDLWLIASGTGIGPFVSILHEPDLWLQFERLIVVHSVRRAAELAYREEILALPDNALFADRRARLHYLPVVTREMGASGLADRIPLLLADGRLEQAICPLEAAYSRVMVCGNPELAADLRRQLQQRGLATGRRGVAGQMAFEQYW